MSLAYCEFILTLVALLIYDHMITLDHDWKMLWKRRWTISTVLFLANRLATWCFTLNAVIPYTLQVSYHVTTI